MTLFAIAGSTDLTGINNGKRICSWDFSNSGAAAVVDLRDGSPTGTRFIQVQLAPSSSASQAHTQQSAPLYPNGVYCEVVSGTIVVSIDLA